MKVSVKFVVFLMGIVCTFFILMALTSHTVRKNEMEHALSTAVEQSLNQLVNKKGYEIRSYQELIADFNQSLLLQINSDSDIKVEVLTADMDKGILDIRVTEMYQSAKGNKKETSCRKTVILEEYTEEKPYHIVSFFVKGKLYNKYSIYSGSKPIEPEQPKLSGETFKYWCVQGVEEAVQWENMEVNNDISFVAVFD